GEERTDEVCDSQDSQIERLHSHHNLDIPTSIADSQKIIDRKQWEKAITRELESFDQMNVWTPLEKKSNMKIIKTQFVFDIKHKNIPNSGIYKAQLVARGFCQRYGIDCKHTYAPTASLKDLRLLFAMEVKSKWIINCFDISVAYLHSKLDEEIYVTAPIEFRPEWTGKVMKSNKAMYGLK
ncbi:hypothetical protein O181_088920, partial [Austropuccinia psidii MF-1]|nr:hypothetical protein [Austropuccinia psidii MF-1]